MTKLTVIYGAVSDALGRKREGWLIVENGQYHNPSPTKEDAVKRAESIAAVRCADKGIIRVIEDKTLQDVLK